MTWPRSAGSSVGRAVPPLLASGRASWLKAHLVGHADYGRPWANCVGAMAWPYRVWRPHHGREMGGYRPPGCLPGIFLDKLLHVMRWSVTIRQSMQETRQGKRCSRS